MQPVGFESITPVGEKP